MSYIGNSPGLATRQLFRYTATANQSSFGGADVNSLTLNYTPGFIDVYVYGRFIPPSDYTASNGSTILFNSGLPLGADVIINAYGAFSPANTLAKDQNFADLLNTDAALTNLGISPFIKTLLNDNDAITARTTLELEIPRAKAFLKCNNNGSVTNVKSFNVSSVVRQATGIVDVTLSNAMDGTTNIPIATSASPSVCCGVVMLNSSNVRVLTRLITTGADIDQNFNMVLFGLMA